jgi:hypothetical protein
MATEYSVFSYLYRDMGNNKVYGDLLIDGIFSEQEICALQRCMDCGIYFTPDKVGIPALQTKMYENYPYNSELDHDENEFAGLRIANGNDMNYPLWGSKSKLLANFRHNPMLNCW